MQLNPSYIQILSSTNRQNTYLVEEDLRLVLALPKALWDYPPLLLHVCIRRICHSRAGGISKQKLIFYWFIKMEWEKHATFKPVCKVCGHFFFIAGWATTIIHSKKTLKLLPQHVDFCKEIIQSFKIYVNK